MTASFRATATLALHSPLRFASRMPQALRRKRKNEENGLSQVDKSRVLTNSHELQSRSDERSILSLLPATAFSHLGGFRDRAILQLWESALQESTRPSPHGALQSWRAAMEHYVGLDVSLKLTAICIVDRTRKIEREGMVACDPETIAAFVKSHAPPMARAE